MMPPRKSGIIISEHNDQQTIINSHQGHVHSLYAVPTNHKLFWLSPQKKEFTKKRPFYVTDPKHLEPRRSTTNKCSLLGQEDKRVTDYQFPHIPLVRRTVLSSSGRQFKVINYVSSGEKNNFMLFLIERDLSTFHRKNTEKRKTLKNGGSSTCVSSLFLVGLLRRLLLFLA